MEKYVQLQDIENFASTSRTMELFFCKKKINGGGIQVHTQAQKIQVVSDPVTSLISAGLGLLLLFSRLPSSFDHPFHGPHAKPYKRHPSSAPNLPTCSLRTCLSISFLLHRIQFSDDEAKR
jgi:hypothetical protein